MSNYIPSFMVLDNQLAKVYNINEKIVSSFSSSKRTIIHDILGYDIAGKKKGLDILGISDEDLYFETSCFLCASILLMLKYYGATDDDMDNFYRMVLNDELYSNIESVDDENETKFIDGFKKRISLYMQKEHDKSFRADWASITGANYIRKDTASISIAVFFDILTNPLCADDYDNAPIVIENFKEATIKEMTIAKFIFPKIYNQLLEIYDALSEIKDFKYNEKDSIYLNHKSSIEEKAFNNENKQSNTSYIQEEKTKEKIETTIPENKEKETEELNTSKNPQNNNKSLSLFTFVFVLALVFVVIISLTISGNK